MKGLKHGFLLHTLSTSAGRPHDYGILLAFLSEIGDDRRLLFKLLTELHRRPSLKSDGRPEKGGDTPERTISKALEF